MSFGKILLCLLSATQLGLAQAANKRPQPIDLDLVDQVFEEICKREIKQPEMVMRQAILETGWFRANFLMSRQNLFGFRNTAYLSFNHWKDSVAYYKAWQDRHYSSSPEVDYSAFLKRIRYASPSYTAHLQKIKWLRPCHNPAELAMPKHPFETTPTSTAPTASSPED